MARSFPESVVLSILSDRGRGMSYQKIGEKYGFSKYTARLVVKAPSRYARRDFDGVPVRGCPNYLISQDGRLFSINMNRICYGRFDADGYLQIGVWINGKVKMLKLHRLVAQAYLPNPDNLPVVTHKNGNKMHNHVSNLMWVEAPRLKYHRAARPTGEQVLAIAEAKGTIDEVAADYGVKPKHVWKIRRGQLV